LRKLWRKETIGVEAGDLPGRLTLKYTCIHVEICSNFSIADSKTETVPKYHNRKRFQKKKTVRLAG